ncbi:hypothetical protein BJV78DRAFT_1283168 [Lactifluus subvellereus]|nr:hypothetical protein BJV78DRAFT_1283168 [Lactifluus subvellereus]
MLLPVLYLNVADGSYGDSSDKFDKEQSDSWKGDTEGILVFQLQPNSRPFYSHNPTAAHRALQWQFHLRSIWSAQPGFPSVGVSHPREYLQVSRRWYTPYKQARIRTFFAEGVEQFGLPRAVEALSTPPCSSSLSAS